ncbi:LLM class flavin-dependent oxidoreductase [Jiangella aurantiaca]|uniref:LLM class flavin-dependent oxidoreductase n=1 Tax=Jiangella aurantiaca TaxID=2530373 RepID=A0A4R5A636_9ACTN|nr:LLM class flavin-dependent oxidoreductase [Jiangella aurantiaca]TDD66540.1 LLM class flavin-dependent oxidoreductase [Jiangella aurantiaca]
MRIGIGLPAAVPGVDARVIGPWAAAAEQAGFASVGVIDRLVYDNLEPLTALAAAATTTSRVELLTTVLDVGWRANPVLLGKQLASVDLLSGGRLTAGLGLGGWPEDHDVSGVPQRGGGARLDDAVATMRAVWTGRVAGQGGPMRRLPAGRPALLFGGLVPAAFTRAATRGDGWVAPLFGHDTLLRGSGDVRAAWERAARPGEPRIVTGRYVSLGSGGGEVADDYLRHYYGAEYWTAARAGTATTVRELHDELARLDDAGVTDVLLYPCHADLDQVARIADVINDRLHHQESWSLNTIAGLVMLQKTW